jgi:Xaa-Pro aminopeptidase
MSQPADSVARWIGLVLCLTVTLAPMRVSAQERNTRMGARGDAFPPIVPSRPRAPSVHYHGQHPADAGDCGSDWQYYNSDITST